MKLQQVEDIDASRDGMLTNGIIPKPAQLGSAGARAIRTDQYVWYFPKDIANDLDCLDLPVGIKGEILNCAWEYARTVIPQYTNWGRYVAWMRIVVLATVVEFRGSLVDVTAGDNVFDYNLQDITDALFGNFPHKAEMTRELRTFLLTTSDKTSERRTGEFFRRYVNALPHSPQQWFRMRDRDGLARFSIAAALTCNDVDDVWFREDQLEILAEICATLYDSVAFYKHRTEGEMMNTFAYMPEDLRIEAHRMHRETLWALDIAWSTKPQYQCILNFMRMFGGPIHMMMRRYRFVEEDLTIGKPETEQVIEQTKANFKLWNRVDAKQRNVQSESSIERYQDIIGREKDLLFTGFAQFLEESGDGHCDNCKYRDSYGAETSHQFGGVELCDACKQTWRASMKSFPARALKAFPELVLRDGSAWYSAPI